MYIYKDYDQAALDHQYNNRAQVPGFAVHLERGERESRKVANEYPFIRDMRYAELERERLDIFSSSRPHSKTLIFIHGGYWQRLDKSDFHFIVPPFHLAGITTVLITYPLAPSVSLDQIVSSCRKAFQWVYNNISSYNGDPGQIYLAGHSAGGHLVSMLLATDWNRYDPSIPGDVIKGAGAFSGLFNLEPILLSYINNDLKLDREMMLRNSSVYLTPASASPFLIAVGGNESMEFRDQSKELYDSWKEKGMPVTFMELPGINHYSIAETFADANSALNAAMLKMILA